MAVTIPRPAFVEALQTSLRRSRITALIGARQSGKTTLARALATDLGGTYFDLERPATLSRLERPMVALEPLRGLVVIDEIQRRPDLFAILRVLADRDEKPAVFLILGSASPDLVRDASESLAGRIEFIELGPFDVTEVGVERWEDLWHRGGMPLSFLAASHADSFAWREGFIRTFLERDVPELGVRIPSVTLRRFWTMLAHWHGQVWNASEFGRSFGLSDHTVRRYLDLLGGLFVVRLVAPWHENVAKRQVKSPKVYVADTGLMHALLGLRTPEALLEHPRCGASWEGFVLEQVLRVLGLNAHEVYFWATHSGAELDLLVMRDGRRWGFEAKFGDAPTMTKSMRSAIDSLALDHLWVVYPGTESYRLDEKTTVVALKEVPGALAALR